MSAERSAFGISSRRILTDSGLNPGVVLVDNGIITATLDDQQPLPSGCEILDVGDQVVMPGLIDSHVHINEPGRTEWEGFETATRAAAAGGITTIADMPLNSNPVTVSLQALEQKLSAAQGKLWVDCAFYGGVIPGNVQDLDSLVDAGVAGFKCFLIHSGIDDFPNVTETDLRASMPVLARKGVPLLVHAELETCCGQPWENPQSYQGFLNSRPRRWENDAIDLMIRLCRETHCRVHIVHLSSSDALQAVAAAKKEGLPISAETCPHYLSFDAEHIPDADTRFKCAPPIRELENCQKLWQGLKEGTIDFVVSDHSPCTPELKFLAQGDLQKAWGGISSLQFGLPAIWTQASKRGFTIFDIANWMCRQPARFLKLDNHKGKIAAGYDADLVIWSPEEQFVVNSNLIQHRHKVTPYEHKELYGVVKKTLVRGNMVFEDGQLVKVPPGKELLLKPKMETHK